ncbi:MAG TPA: M48 family peptidase, partial [Methylophaga sp.]|nr:M48 family peptidase [Methylophaga sp.]
MRKLIVIVLLGLVSWPITTMYAADIDLPDFGDSAGALISPLQEYQIGRSFFWRLQQSVDLVEDPEVNGYVQSVGYRLVANSDSPSLPFTFFVVPDPSINAFAAPGGFIGIHTGLILASETEDEMASVMAHEIAHVTQRHLVRSYEQSQQRSLPSTIAMIGAALLAIANPEAGMAGLMAVQAGGVQSQINFTRSNEKEADNIGMLTLVHSGFDAQAMPAFFERLQKSSRFYTSDSVPEFLRTHPVTTNRIAEARGRAVTYPVKRQLSDTLQFYLIREKLRVMGSTDLAQLIQYYASSLESGNNVNQTATRYGYSLALSAIGDYFLARAVLQPLIDQDEDRLSYQLALADIEIGLGEMGNALA